MNIVVRHGRVWQRAYRQSWRALVLLLAVVPMLLPQSAAPVSAAPISYTESVDLDTKFTTTFTLDVGDNKFSGSLEPTPSPGGRDTWKMVIPANHRISRVRYSRGYLGSANSVTFVFDACWYSTPETTSSSFNQPLTVDGPRDVCILIFSNYNPGVIDWEVTVTVEEIPPNNPPVITVPGPLMTESGVPITFSGSDQISISEPDGDNLEVQLQVTGGTITLSNTSGLDFYQGDGVGDWRVWFAGSAAAINAALNGAVFTPADGFSGWASILIRATDDYWLTAISDTISITVFPPSGLPTDNNPPIATNDTYATNEDTPLTIAAPSVLCNDTDADGDTLTAGLVRGPANGTLTFNADGSFTYTPKANWNGTDSFTYLTYDGTTFSNVATVTITVNAVNDPPVSTDDAYTTDEDMLLTITAPGVLGNDTDVENDPLTAVLENGPANGTLTLNPDGSFTYTPKANWNGTDNFTYRASDGTANSDIATVTITVNAINDAPVAADDAYTTDEDTPLTIASPGVLGNDTDIDGNPLTAVLENGPANGTLTFNADGSFTYTPKANWNGTDSFTYLTYDGTAFSNVATVTIAVNEVNDAPVASDDAYTTDEDTPLTITAPGVLGNDTDVENHPFTAVLENGPANGTLTLNADGSFTYTPKANWNGTDNFTYRASDGTANSDIATVTITVNAINDAPVAADDAYTIDEDNPLTIAAPGVLGNDSDVDGDTLTAALVTSPDSGTLTLNPDGAFTYTPKANWNGTDTFTYRASDGTTNSNVATVTITVNSVNDVPVAMNESYITDEDTPLSVPAPGVLENDSDIENAPLTTVHESGPANGTLTLNPDGSFTYTPNANLNGTDTFTYRASDGTDSSNVATVTITVNAVNDAPVAADDAYATAEDTPLTIATPGLLANDSDIDSAALTVVLESGPANGTLTLNADGSFAYTPNTDWNGTDTFTYRASDGTANSNVATATITVNAINDAPVSADDSYTTDEDTPLTIAAPGVLGNDSDADGDTLTAVLENGPTNGTLTLNSDGSFTYTPNTDWHGTDTFTYRASDGIANSNVATVTITVGAVNDVPVAVDDAYTTDEDKPLSVPAPGVLGNDSDVEGDALTAVLDSGPTHGTVTLNPDGSFEYVPALGFFGTDTFTYALNDGGAVSSVATVTITVGLVNGNTYARDDWGEVSMNGSTLLDVLANDTDPDGDPLHIAQVSEPRYGVAIIQGNRIAYTPTPGFVGTDTFTYIAADDFGSQHRATVSVTVWKPVPLCADFDGSTSEVVRASVPDGTVPGGSAFCRTLVEHGEFVRPSAEVGRPEVLNLGVLQAVDVFALRHDGSATATFAAEMTVCLQGQGTLLYLDATIAPRAIVPLPAFSRDGYTCGSVPNAGTVVLVSSAAGVTPPATNSPAPVRVSTPLANCMVTTRNILNLRAEPNSAGAVIRMVPYDVTLTAFERAGAWFYVDYLGERGWLSADYVTPQASCGG